MAAPGVLANDTGGQSLTAVKVAGPAHGTLTLNANGSFAYTPAAGYVGPNSFSRTPPLPGEGAKFWRAGVVATRPHQHAKQIPPAPLLGEGAGG